MRIVNCGYCRCKVAELEAKSRIKPYTLMLCQECAKMVGTIVAAVKEKKSKNPFEDFESIFGRKR
jgi:hypothetical protein